MCSSNEMRIWEGDALSSREALASLVVAVYPPEVLASVPWRNVVTAPTTHRIIICKGSDAVCAAAYQFRSVHLNGILTMLAGIGGVMTHPNFRRNGFGSAAMQAVQGALDRDGHVEFGLLFCEPKNSAFYERLGWSVFRGTVLADQPNGTIHYDALGAMVFPFGSVSPRSGLIDLRGPPW